MKEKKILKLIEEIEDLPELPHVAHKILELTLNEKVDNGEIAKYVEASPSLALKILKIINSPIYGLKNKVNSLSQAIGLLGRKTIKNLALTTFIIDNIMKKVKNSYIVWENFIYSITAGKRIGKKLKVEEDEIFTLLLIVNIPLILICYYFPNEIHLIKNFYQLKKHKKIIKKFLKKVSDEWKIDKQIANYIEKYFYCLTEKKDFSDNNLKLIHCSLKIANFISLNGESIEELKKELNICFKANFDEINKIIKLITENSTEIFNLFEIPFEEKHYEELIYMLSKANKKISNVLVKNEKLLQYLDNTSSLLSLALNYIPIGVVTFEDNKMVMINLEAIKILKMNTEDLEEEITLSKFVDKYIKRGVIDLTSEYLKFETKLKNGEPVEIIYLGHEHLFPRKIFFIKSLMEEYKLKQEYSNLKETYINILKCAGDGIVILNLELNIVFVNDKFYEIFKFDKKHSITNRKFFEFLKMNEEDKLEFKQKILKLLKNNVKETFMEIKTNDERYFYLTMTLFKSRKTIRGIQIFIRDITSYKKLQERAEKFKEISIKNKVVVELAGATAHKLNQPLTTLLFIKDILLEKISNEELKKYLDKIEYSVEEISKIVKELSKITKYETRKYLDGTDIIELK